MIRVMARRNLEIGGEADVVRVRHAVRLIARASGFDAFATAAITTATSELTRNALVHGGGGVAVVEEVVEDGLAGLRLTFRDTGPGISDLDRALAGGHSTSRTLGLGLSGSKRLVDGFEITTETGVGTTVVITKWARRRW
ncbi:MAG: serine/threonine-protein kinase RsbT [Myxococcota bacterium]|jgi:serine/threonine-protein kinase RsbT